MPEYDRNSQIQAFDDKKMGVKGLIDAGITKIPKFFVHENLQKIGKGPISGTSQFSIPVIDLEGLTKDAASRDAVIADIRNASAEWGFFQIINHGIPGSVLGQIIKGVRQLHEQDIEGKETVLYARLKEKSVI